MEWCSEVYQLIIVQRVC